MIVTRALPTVLVSLPASSAFAYNPVQHEEFTSAAATAVCAKDQAAPLCAELKENLPFLLHGSVHEDTGAKGHDEILNYARFKDEEGFKQYGPCREYVVAGKNYMYCNHYFFVDSFQSGGPEGACGKRRLSLIIMAGSPIPRPAPITGWAGCCTCSRTSPCRRTWSRTR